MKWQDISTAPREDYYGDDVLLSDGRLVYPGHWYKDRFWIADGERFAPFDPTHWMPLPEPPSETAEEVMV